MGTLYIVATPIGNLKDITLRAIEIFETTEYLDCEDTRHTGILLSHLEAKGIMQQTPHHFLSFHNDNEYTKTPEIIELLQKGHNVALVSDAGTPTISDPGFKLVRECLAQKIPVVTIPGASSPIAALTVAGLPTDKFLFVGYLPKKEGNRKKLLENLKQSLDLTKATVVFFEGPHRLTKALKDIQAIFGDIEITFAKELTKVHESVTKEKISATLERYKKVNPKGEFVLLFNVSD